MPSSFDAFLLVSFGGPEKHEDVIPFLENVLRGKNVPRERLLEVAEHYYHFDGKSPINRQCEDLLAKIRAEFAAHNLNLPVYWGNRNWHPLLSETVAKMHADGVRHALALATSAYGSYSGCRQYREDLDRALAPHPGLVIDKIRPFFSHPGFIEAAAAQVREAQQKLPGADVVYTAHSVPLSMAHSSPYERQLRFVCEQVQAQTGAPNEPPTLVFQSRSGPPAQPWLEPDIGDYIRQTTSRRLIVVPIGFLSDHMEVLFDLDTEAAAIARARGIEFLRAATVGTHPRFIASIRQMVQSAINGGSGQAGEAGEIAAPCPPDCCQPPRRPSAPPSR